MPEDESIIIEEGDVVGIIGENGAGKSTFINCIINKIKCEGEIIRNYSPDKLGIQFQTNHYNRLMKVSELIQIVSSKSKFDLSLKSQIDQFYIAELLNKRIGKLSIVKLSTADFHNLLKELKNIDTVDVDEKTCGLIVADER